MSQPQVTFNTLPHADGSATYTHAGYTVVGTVNGPLEAQRRDELPEEAFLEVNLRPASGTGGPRERHLESLVHRTLRSLILTHAYPRCLIQLTLQILRTPSASSSSAPIPQTASHLPPLPALLHTGLLALLNGNIPLKGTATSVLVAVGGGAGKSGDAIVIDPGEKDVKLANSLHVFAWTSQGELLLAESEGVFGMDEWEEAAEAAKKVCKGSEAGGDVDMVGSGETGGLDGWLQRNVGAEMARTTRWKGEV